MLRRAAFAALCVFVTACSQSHSTIPALRGSYGIAASNHFAQAKDQAISDNDIDSYIAASVTGPDRQLAHTLMAAMPPSLRGDFISVDESGHVVSNNPNLLQYVKLSHASAPVAAANVTMTKRVATIQPMDGYVSQCAPPGSNTGAFIRDVASCGMTDGWGFVNVPCNTTYMAPGDAGYLYMEIVGSGGASGGSLIEGGFQYNYHGGGSADTIQAYVRTSYSVGGGGPGYQQMNYSNPGYEFGCGQNLTITHGIAMAANDWVYTMVGQLPSNINPQTQFVNMNSQFFYPTNYVWLWTPPGPDVYTTGTDFAGYTTPCRSCTVAAVTSIAQSGGYHGDGSYFGISGGFPMINWMEVIFGQYASACTGQSGGTCQIWSSSDPTIYYAGTQTYPNSSVAGETQGPTGWGPYETFEGISTSGNVIQSRQAFTEPRAPIPCTIDGYGYCSMHTSSNTDATCIIDVWNAKIQDFIPKTVHYTQNQVYATYRSDGRQVGTETQTTTKYPDDGSNCAIESVTWSPSEPRAAFGDPNLP